MDTLITFTPAQLIAGIATICGTITAVAAVIAVIIKIINRAKAPGREQDESFSPAGDPISQRGEMGGKTRRGTIP